MKHPLLALEIGSHKVRAVVAEAVDNDVLHILGVGECMSDGVRKGEITDLEAATQCVGIALARAEDAARITANQVHLVFSCGDIQAVIEHAMVPIQSSGRVVTEDELDDLRQNARGLVLPLEREIVRSVPQQYYVDDQPGVTNPLGMLGSRLELDMLILHGVTNRLENNVLAASGTRAEILSAEFGGMCCGLAILEQEEKQRGALVIDLGGGTTDFVSYIDGYPSFAGSVPVGGYHVTYDISAAVNVSLEVAEELKCSKASCELDLASRQTSFSLNPDDLVQTIIHQEDLDRVAHARVEETLLVIRDMMERENPSLLQRLSAGVFLTGGAARMSGVVELARNVFKTRTQLGIPFGVSGLEDEENPDDRLLELTAPIGLLRKVARDAGTSRRRKKSRGLKLF